MKLILASASPRRTQILRDAGFAFEVVPTTIDESPKEGESAEAMTRRLAEAKAQAALVKVTQFDGQTFVIGADTIVELDGQLYGKPTSLDDAKRTLRQLSGRGHRVVSGIAVIRVADRISRIETEATRVHFTDLTDKQIDAYVQTGEPLDKAGAYAIQGFAGRFIDKVEGCYFNVVGLPLARVYKMLSELGWRETT